jgi:SPP1 gp7 family putative phage head morphogenesis protein
VQGFINGEHSDKMAVVLRDRFDTSFYNASRVARTEMARMEYEAHRKIYNDNGVDEVMWVASLDEKTCPMCGPRDGRRYQLGQEPAIPAHPHCRCDIAPAYSDEVYTVRRHNQKDEDLGIKPVIEGREVVSYSTFEEWREANNIKIL